ncbi:MTOR-associated protein MEAK7 [Protopterus annectens]|uniref:MTOR-associated protein MEAK7 n=1 Tax=Protopterus annectens TaxID=7888 RepID=UPI001CFB201C|nr:MTOR-associated protein MEAK7 [Protopterus annectens]XP_043937406.1 MTOR-associated protein MEAK7 [Protopterus annectens]
MGNAESSSFQKHLSRFVAAEQSIIERVFDALSSVNGSSEAKSGKTAKGTVSLTMLKAYIKDTLPDSMITRLHNGMCTVDISGKSAGAATQFGREHFVVFLSEVLVGNAEEKSFAVMPMISVSNNGSVTGKEVLEFTDDLISSVLHVLKEKKMLQGWNLEKTHSATAGVKSLAMHFVLELKKQETELPQSEIMRSCYDRSTIEDWIYRVCHISSFLTFVVSQSLSIDLSTTDEQSASVKLLPRCRGPEWTEFSSILDLPSAIYLNSQLPSELQHQWRLLFSNRIHGESFSQLCGKIVRQGPTIIILKDTDGHIFGGFASHSWEFKPQFQGDSSCFLFTTYPSLGVYTYTGYNDHYMYLNSGQQTMPNGLGMGGQHDYFGLWLDSDYGKGHSKAKPRCTTYNSPQLSAKETFTIDALEVWGTGKPPQNLPASAKKSVLDVDPEAQALLDLIGKSRKSEGLREPVDEDDEA